MVLVKKTLVALAMCAAVLVSGAEAAAEGNKKPHVLLVLVDDFGWNNIGYHRKHLNEGEYDAEVNTPTMDRLTRQGIELDRHYTYNYCSPSRSSLQTGRLPVHVSVENTDPIAVNPDDPVSGFSGIPRNMTGIAEKMASAGYRTYMTGKWDAGMATYEHTPMGRGYEKFFGYFHHANSEWSEKLDAGSTVHADLCSKQGADLVDLWNTTGPAFADAGRDYEDAMFQEHSVNIIRDHNPEEPLFLFHSFRSVHTPLDVPKENEKMYRFLMDKYRRRYAAMVNYADYVLGEMVSELETKDMWKDTVVILSSDNGGPIYGFPVSPTGLSATYASANNLPLRGGKMSDWEGGIRVNAFVSGGYLPAKVRGTKMEDMISIADWYGTLCEAAGVEAFDSKGAKAGLPPVDSVSHWKRIMGEAKDAKRHELHVSKKTLIQGRYKLLTGADNMILPLFSEEYMPFDVHAVGYGPRAAINTLTRGRRCDKGCLFDIYADPNEDHEITKDHPEIVERMMKRLEELNKDNFNPDRGQPSALACDMANKHYKGFYGPFVDVENAPIKTSAAHAADAYFVGDDALFSTDPELQMLVQVLRS